MPTRSHYPLLTLIVTTVLANGCGGAGNNGETRAKPSDEETPNSRTIAREVTKEAIASRRPVKPKDNRPPLFGNSGARSASSTGDDCPPAQKLAVKPQTVYRPADNRPKHDDDRLKKLGIHKYESKHLRLYSDVDPKVAKPLPAVIDAAYDAWVAYFGKLPPDRDGADFQITGYVMQDKPLFKRAGLIPGDLPPFPNGRHRGYEFWMNDPPQGAYYRRHLLIHEATHCFMYAVRDPRFATWYMEGMAEFFGTHTIDKTGKLAFGVIPAEPKAYKGSGRVEYIRNDCKAGAPKSIKEVVEFKPDDYLKNQPYAWSWALCLFLDTHPRYQKPFRSLGRIHTASTFDEALRKLVRDNSPRIFSEWHLFAMGFDYGYDPVRAAIEIRPGEPLKEGKPIECTIAANRGWQSSGVWVEKGEVVEITATGRFELAQKPKPWVSEPRGISFTYDNGRPLGELQAVLVPDSKKSLPITVPVLPHGPVGTKRRFRAEIKGTLYLRVNDSLGDLANNHGKLKATIRRAR